MSAYVWDCELSTPWDPALNVVWKLPSPQFTSTPHGPSFAPGSLKLPREKLFEAPSVPVWSAGGETDGATLATMTLKVAEPESPSLSVTVTVTV